MIPNHALYTLAILLSALSASACAGEAEVSTNDTAPRGVALGELCRAGQPCEAHLLCVDGRCVERPWPDLPLETPEQAPPRVELEEGDSARIEPEGDAYVEARDTLNASDAEGVQEVAGDAITPGPEGEEVSSSTSDSADGDGDAPPQDSVQSEGFDGTQGEEVWEVESEGDAASLRTRLSRPGPVASDALESEVFDTNDPEDTSPPVIPPPKKVVFLVAEDSWRRGSLPC